MILVGVYDFLLLMVATAAIGALISTLAALGRSPHGSRRRKNSAALPQRSGLRKDEDALTLNTPRPASMDPGVITARLQDEGFSV